MIDYTGRTAVITALQWVRGNGLPEHHMATAAIDGERIDLRIWDRNHQALVRAGYRDIEWTCRDELKVSIPVIVERADRNSTIYDIREIPPREDAYVAPLNGSQLQPGMIVAGTSMPPSVGETYTITKWEVIRLFTEDNHSMATIQFAGTGRQITIRLRDTTLYFVERASLPVSV